ncbi:murein biosynthesis integral membrane protein MurJ [Blastomonas sp.]|uniref:murein biosynthesis integral membrane protein MurJ n=1 Tax=Blastomonas sp. TaxID=1909299 RepID=UPI0035948BE5
MNLLKSASTIAGLTLVSRIFGFARDILLARVLGAGLAADAYQLAFRLPNTFRRLFAEGAFSVAFVPMVSRKMATEDGEAQAEAFTNDVLSVFIWVLLGFTGFAMLVMPGIVWLLARDYMQVDGKFDLAVLLSRITFPYLMLISIVALLSGILNARSRFGPGAFAPVLFNLVLIAGVLTGAWLRGDGDDDRIVVIVLSVAVALSGAAQLVYLWWCVRREGLRLRLSRPRLTPDVRELGRLILPATFGAGVYQISQLIDTFFATQLPQGSLTMLSMADRLNQMPLGIVGIALGTAILPSLSRSIATDDKAAASRIQSDAVELALLLTLPAAAALWVCAPAFVSAFFVGGRFTAENGAITAMVVQALVAGLPAYVLVKILTPGFFARRDTKTPVYTAAAALGFNVALILILIEPFGIVGLAAAGAGAAWLNTILLYVVLRRRDHFRLQTSLIWRIARQVVAAGAMAALLWWLVGVLDDWFVGSILERAGALAIIVSGGALAYFAVGFAVGAVDRDRIARIIKRRKAAEQE